MSKERQFKRHVVIAVDAAKEIFDNDQSINHTTHQMAAHFGISRNVLQEGFKQLHGVSIRQYKLIQRMELSRQLLEEGNDVKQVSIKLNYATPSAFVSAFKRFFGMTPTESLQVLYKRRSAAWYKI